MPISSLTSIPQIVQSRAVTHNFSQEEEERRNSMTLNRDFFYGKQEQLLDLVNEDQKSFTVNFVKPIVRKRSSLLYNTELTREFEGPAESIRFLEELYKDIKIDTFMLQVDLNAELTGSTLVTPILDESKLMGMKLRMYDAGSFSALTDEDDPEQLEALSIVKLVDRIMPGRDTEVQRILKQQIWTVDDISVYEGEVNVASETNELGFIPFTNFRAEEVYDQFLGHSPTTDIRNVNNEINQLISDLAFGIRFQAFSPVAISGWSGDTLVTLHPGRALNMPSGADAKVLALSPKIAEVQAFIQFLEEKIYETNSVPKIAVVGGGEAKSGKELLIRWYPLLQVFKEKSTRFQKYELSLANMILRVAGLPLVTNLKVNYSSESILPVREESDTLTTDINLNIKTAIDEVLRRNPQLSEIEAEAIVLANRDFNEQMKPVAPQMEDDIINTNEDSSEEELEEEEENG